MHDSGRPNRQVNCRQTESYSETGLEESMPTLPRTGLLACNNFRLARIPLPFRSVIVYAYPTRASPVRVGDYLRFVRNSFTKARDRSTPCDFAR